MLLIVWLVVAASWRQQVPRNLSCFNACSRRVRDATTESAPLSFPLRLFQ